MLKTKKDIIKHIEIEIKLMEELLQNNPEDMWAIGRLSGMKSLLKEIRGD